MPALAPPIPLAPPALEPAIAELPALVVPLAPAWLLAPTALLPPAPDDALDEDALEQANASAHREMKSRIDLGLRTPCCSSPRPIPAKFVREVQARDAMAAR